MTKQPRPTQWEAGRMLQTAREQRGMSKRRAAKAINMSESWWRKAEEGGQVKNGKFETLRPAPESLAKAAHVVGIPPRKILEAGGYTDIPAGELPTMRQEIHDLIDLFADEQLPAIKGYLDGLHTGMGQGH